MACWLYNSFKTITFRGSEVWESEIIYYSDILFTRYPKWAH